MRSDFPRMIHLNSVSFSSHLHLLLWFLRRGDSSRKLCMERYSWGLSWKNRESNEPLPGEWKLWHLERLSWGGKEAQGEFSYTIPGNTVWMAWIYVKFHKRLWWRMIFSVWKCLLCIKLRRYMNIRKCVTFECFVHYVVTSTLHVATSRPVSCSYVSEWCHSPNTLTYL